jgi:hypothetical protein
MSWINGNGFVPNDGLNATRTPWGAGNGATAGPFPQGSPANVGYGPASADAFRPAWFGGAADPLAAFGSTFPGGTINPSSSSGIGAILSQLAGRIAQYIGKLGNALLGTQPQTGPSNGAATFANVSLASTGDPHLSVTGTRQNADGSTKSVDSHFDSMTAHPDLFSTHDFSDGFTVSTAVTQPSASGVTLNASATASMEGGRESVTLSNNGAVSVIDHGQSVALSAGQSVTLTGGQRVSEGTNGSVSIAESSYGENLTTTFTPAGGGVDVTASGQNVTLAGDLINGARVNPL